MSGFIYSSSKTRRSGTVMQKRKFRGSDRKYHEAREVLPGYPKHFRFTSRDEILAYMSGDKVCCLLCGKHYRCLPSHIARVHGVDAEHYKSIYNIPRQFGLTCSGHKELKENHFRGRRRYDGPRAPQRRPIAAFEADEKRARARAAAVLASKATAEAGAARRAALIPKFLDLMDAGMTAGGASAALGLNRAVYKDWLKKEPGFAARYRTYPPRYRKARVAT